MTRVFRSKFYVFVLIILFCSSVAIAEAADCSEGGARDFVDATARGILDIARSESLTSAERHGAYLGILREVMANERIARGLIGPYWRKMSRGQRKVYAVQITDILHYTIADYISSVRVLRYRIRGSSRLGKDFLVKMLAELPEENIEVAWRIRCYSKPSEALKLVDFLFRGVSLTAGLRSRTSAIIASSDILSFLTLLEHQRKVLVEKAR